MWKNMAVNSFRNWFVNPETRVGAVEDFKGIGHSENGLDKQRNFLAEHLDKNQLYVHLSEIDDDEFDVDEDDIALNRSLYGD